MSTVCIVQARMGSTRLPGKVLQPILGKPMLWWVMHRLSRCRQTDQVVVATTTSRLDDPLVELCKQEHWPAFRGSEVDVLDRYHGAAKQFRADHIVRVTSDCPLVDPTVTDRTVATFLSIAPAPDYVSNTLERTYPRGLDTEVFSMQALVTAWEEDRSPWREHVTPFLYRNPERFRLHGVTNPVDFSHYRWTVDTPEDLELVRQVYSHFGHGGFAWQQVLEAYGQHSEWTELNCNIEQKTE